MNADHDRSALVPQRWERPFNFPPGFWKRQLPGKLLNIAGRGDIDALRDVLAEHPDYLSKRGPHGRTFLWEATRRGRLDMVRWLVEHGADLDATGSYNRESHVQITPYCAAVYYRRPAIATYLRSKNPRLDIFRAAFLGDQQRVADALSADPALLQAEDPEDQIYGMPLLAFPVAGGHMDMVDFLLRRGAPVVQYSSGLLALAASSGRLDILESLVAHGADVRATDSGVFGGASDLRILHYLLDHGAQLRRPGKNGFPPLVYVARGDKGERPDKVRLLLDHGAAVDARGPHGRTALHYAAAAGYLEVLQVLVDHGADLEARDEQGLTALEVAMAAGKTAAAGLLSEHGASP